MPHRGRRRLAAIMFTDIVGYSSMMQEDETRGRMIRDRHRQVFEQCMNQFNGEIVQYYGDGTLSVFDSAVSAVECAICMQKQLRTYPQVPLRIGIHLGDILHDDTEVFGHGVNVAARIEPACVPGGIYVSGKVHDELRGHPWLKTKALGVYKFKNIEHELSLYAVVDKEITVPQAEDIAQIEGYTKKVSISTAARQSDVIRKYLNDNRTRRKRRTTLATSLFAALAIVAAITFGDRLFEGTIPPAEEGISIAVLPFSDMSADARNEYFSDGMTEDILTLLSQIDGIRVTSRTSVMRYKNTDKSVKEIARELGVNHILEGSVRTDGERIRVNAQLIKASDDSHMWAQTYDEEMTHVFDVQNQVANDIASQLDRKLSEASREKIREKKDYNIRAYDLYLKGRQAYRQYTRESMQKAIALFEESLDVEPSYPYAYAGLGDAYAQLAFMDEMDEMLLDTAILMSAHAIELNPKLSEGYKALGLAFHYQGQFDQAAIQYEKALELDPYNDMAANNLSMIAREKGDMATAAEWAQRNYEMNRSAPSSATVMADLFVSIGEYGMAENVIDEAIASNPDAYELQAMKGICSVEKGDLEDAERWARNILDRDPGVSAGYDLLGNTYTYENKWAEAAVEFRKAGNASKSEAEELIYESMTMLSESKSGENIAMDDWTDMLDQLEKQITLNPKWHKAIVPVMAGMKAEMGMKEDAVKVLEKASESDWMHLTTTLDHPMFNDLRDSPDFQAIANKAKRNRDSIRTVVTNVIMKQSGS